MTEKEVSTEELIAKFYSKPFYLSYSGLNKLLYSPSLFYKHYVLNQKEDKLESYLIDGKVIHCLLLDNGSFNEQFLLTPTSLPTGNTKLVVDKVYAHYLSELNNLAQTGVTMTALPDTLEGYPAKIIEVLLEIKLHQALKTDQQRIDKIVTEEAKSYWEFLKIRGGKDLVDAETMQRCNAAVEALRANSQASELLGLLTNEMQNVEIINEILMFCETDKQIGLKGVIDSIKIDHDNKIISINDLKTTGKTISDFKETIEFYNYWSQAAIYMRLVWYAYDALLQDPDWKVQFNFIVIDKYQQVYCFEVSIETMKEWQLRLEDKLNEANWHYVEKNYTLPYEFATGKVIL